MTTAARTPSSSASTKARTFIVGLILLALVLLPVSEAFAQRPNPFDDMSVADDASKEGYVSDSLSYLDRARGRPIVIVRAEGGGTALSTPTTFQYGPSWRTIRAGATEAMRVRRIRRPRLRPPRPPEPDRLMALCEVLN